MSGETEFYLVAVPAVIVLGLSKGGFTGLSSLAMPMLSLVTSPVRAAAIVLPILIVQDWVSVWAFRRDFSPRNLLILIPSSMIGVASELKAVNPPFDRPSTITAGTATR